MNIYWNDHIPAMYSMRSLPQFVGGPLDLEALGLSLYSLLVNPVLATDHPAPHLLRLWAQNPLI